MLQHALNDVTPMYFWRQNAAQYAGCHAPLTATFPVDAAYTHTHTHNGVALFVLITIYGCFKLPAHKTKWRQVATRRSSPPPLRLVQEKRTAQANGAEKNRSAKK